MTEKTRKILTEMMRQFVANHNDERADALAEVLEVSHSDRLQSTWRKTDMYTFSCNNCKHRVNVSDVKNYCPNCGAEMKG